MVCQAGQPPYVCDGGCSGVGTGVAGAQAVVGDDAARPSSTASRVALLPYGASSTPKKAKTRVRGNFDATRSVE